MYIYAHTTVIQTCVVSKATGDLAVAFEAQSYLNT